MYKKIENLKYFYDIIFNLKELRKKLVKQCLNNQPIDPYHISALSEALESFENIPKTDHKSVLYLNDKTPITLDLTYEIDELKKDIYFLKNPEDKFYSYLSSLHPDFMRYVKEGEYLLKDIRFLNFITDRDGTTNNYCGRYLSSVQSVYNAVFLTRFAQAKAKNSIILSSAPLENGGLTDITIIPPQIFIYAGSNGREFLSLELTKKILPIENEKQQKLNLLNNQLTILFKQPEYEIFKLIGSGLQYKLGQTTVTYQDLYKSIPVNKALDLSYKIRELVNNMDPKKQFFRIKDTGRELDIILTIASQTNPDALKDFDKGEGITFISQALKLDLNKGPNLICGDTYLDLPMLETAVRNSVNTWAIFVNKSNELKDKVSKISPNYLIIPEPDMLVAILNNISKK